MAPISVYFPSDMVFVNVLSATATISPQQKQQRRQQLYCWVILPRDFFLLSFVRFFLGLCVR